MSSQAGKYDSICYERAWCRLWTRRFADPLADAETFRINAAGQLLEIGGKTTQIEDIEGQYMGLLKFAPPAWSAVEALLDTLDAPVHNRLDMTGLLRQLLARKQLTIVSFGTSGQWGEIDNSQDVALYQEMISEGELQLEGGIRQRADTGMTAIHPRGARADPELGLYRTRAGKDAVYPSG